jgi:hypothetical protein
MADLTNIDFTVNGVNQDTNYIKQYAFMPDAKEYPAMAAVGTHDIIELPEGEAVTKLRLFVMEDAASSGAATVQFKIAFNGIAENINSTAIAITDLKAGDVIELPVNKIKGFEIGNPGIVQFTVGTAALTALKFMLVIETIPVKAFANNG